MRAEDMLPDTVNQCVVDGVVVRKGTVGAFLFNARVLADPTAGEQARIDARQDIVAAIPALRALGLFDVMEIRDPVLREMVDRI